MASALHFLAVLILALGIAGPQPLAAQQAIGDAADPPVAERSDIDVLIDVLENDAARTDLLERLRSEAAPDTVAETLTNVASPDDGISLARQIALVTQSAVEMAIDRAGDVGAALVRLPNAFDGLSGLDLTLVLENFGELLTLIVATVGGFLVLRGLAKPRFAEMGQSIVDEHSVIKLIAVFVASIFIDLFIVILAWAMGYGVAVLALGDLGAISIRQTLYLNAFLLVEILKVGIRMVLSPTTDKLRLLPLSDRFAISLTRWVGLIISLVGYGQLLVVPIVSTQISVEAAQALTMLIALSVLSIAIALVLGSRRRLAAWLASDEAAGASRTPGVVARNWHWPVLLYFIAMFLIVLASPPQLVFQTLITSGQVVLIALVGIALSSLLTRLMVAGIMLPDNVSARLPLLEGRLNRFVPRGLFVLRTVIVVFVVLVVLSAIGLIDFRGWLTSQVGLTVTGALVSSAIILITAFVIWLALSSYVDFKLNPDYGDVPTARETTLLTLLRNAGSIALVVVTLMFVLAEVGLNIAPLLASAGVLGLAIGFGAQKLVQDIITGLFIQFENAINVGDVITVGGITGAVERLTIRSVSLRDLDGVFHIIPFSAVDSVSNYTRDFSYFVLDMGVAYRENTDEVKQALYDSYEVLRRDPEQGRFVIGDLEWFGLDSFGDSAVVMKSRVKTRPGKQWGVGRAWNGIVKRIFDERGIEIPFPHQTLYLGETKDGTTQPLNVNTVMGRAPREKLPEVSSPFERPDLSRPTQDGPLDED